MNQIIKRVSLLFLSAVFVFVFFEFGVSRASAANLIQNPSLETSDSGGMPTGWAQGSWGTLDATFSYPVTGIEGVKAAKVEITNHASGDAKWYFNDVAVKPGMPYVFSDSYISNVPTLVVARFLLTGGTFQYVQIGTPATADSGATFSTTLQVPFNAVSVTVFHLLNTNGSLTVDNFSFSEAGAPEASNIFNEGRVSLSFDDGWLSQYNKALPILQNAGLKGTFYIISKSLQNTPVTTNTELVQNPSLEDAAKNPARPANWFKDLWGNNNAVFTYPVAGNTTPKSAKVEITSYTSGDAKWYFNDISVTPGKKYHFIDNYTSNATTSLIARYKKTNGTFGYVAVAKVGPSSAWKKFETDITVPNGVTSFTMLHVLQSKGVLSVDDFSFKSLDVINSPTTNQYMSPEQVVAMNKSGHEIGAHTQTHPHLPELSAADATLEIAGSKNDLLSLGVTSVATFAYPYGEYNDAVVQTVKNAGFVGARSVDVGYNLKNTDKYKIQVQNVEQGTTAAEIRTWIDSALQNKVWLVLVYHQIDENQFYGSTSAILEDTTSYLKAQNAKVVTVAQGLQDMKP